MIGIRLQKVLASAGLGSRRKCEELIASGRVTVDGQVVDRLGTRIDPDTAVVRVDGSVVVVAEGVVVLAMNKPLGHITAMSDPRGRPCVGDLVGDRMGPGTEGKRIFHVGRLDADTEGLLLLTNDGDLAHRLSHPSFGVAKTYVAEVHPRFAASALRALAQGVEIDGRRMAVADPGVVSSTGDRTVVRLTIHEGRNRIVRRAFEQLGHEVSRLVRTRFGPIAVDGLGPGQVRELTRSEMDQLYTASQSGGDGAGEGRPSRSM